MRLYQQKFNIIIMNDDRDITQYLEKNRQNRQKNYKKLLTEKK